MSSKESVIQYKSTNPSTVHSTSSLQPSAQTVNHMQHSTSLSRKRMSIEHHSSKASESNADYRARNNAAFMAKRPCIGPGSQIRHGAVTQKPYATSQISPMMQPPSVTSSPSNLSIAAAHAAAFAAIAANAAGGFVDDSAAAKSVVDAASRAAMPRRIPAFSMPSPVIGGVMSSLPYLAPPLSAASTMTSTTAASQAVPSNLVVGPRQMANNEINCGNAFGDMDGVEMPAAGSVPWMTSNEDWNNVESVNELFSTIITTMERLRYAMLVFQQRAKLSQIWEEKFQIHNKQRQHNSDQKIEEVKRKADAVVQEVKTAAVTELQKAVVAAERKALQMIAIERAQMEKLLKESHYQEDRPDMCWNCGRRAGQTCSGCGRARYCTVFCQHKDWSKHRDDCLATSTPITASVTSPTSSHSPVTRAIPATSVIVAASSPTVVDNKAPVASMSAKPSKILKPSSPQTSDVQQSTSLMQQVKNDQSMQSPLQTTEMVPLRLKLSTFEKDPRRPSPKSV